MNKKLRELYETKNSLKEQARVLQGEGKIEEAKALLPEIKKIEDQIELEIALAEEEKQNIENKNVEAPKNEEVAKFVNAVRTKFKNAMSEGSNADGGFTVPQDLQTKINTLRESKDAIQNFITVEPVQTLSGSRVFKARAQQTGFAEVAEDGTIAEKATPQFTNLPYSLKKYAGFFKVTNELLKDSDQAIRSTLVDWIGNESRVTRNKLILAELDKKAKTAIAGVDDIKDVLNVQLDPAFKATAVILTNQDGFNHVDKLKDADGNYLLQPSVSAPTGKQLFGVPVVVVSNKDLPTVTGNAPFIIGDLKEAVVMFDRQKTEIAASDVAGDAFTNDITMFRAIEREQVVTKDSEAFVYGQIAIV